MITDRHAATGLYGVRERRLTLVCLVWESIIRTFHAGYYVPGPDLTCFITFPTSSAIWLALMDTTCTFQYSIHEIEEEGLMGREGDAGKGGLGQCDLTLPSELLSCFGWLRLTRASKIWLSHSLSYDVTAEKLGWCCDVMIVQQWRFFFFFFFTSSFISFSLSSLFALESEAKL